MSDPTTSELDRAIAAYRAALLRREQQAQTALARAYAVAYRRIRTRLDVLIDQIAAARAAGETVKPSWLREQSRLLSLNRQVNAAMADFAVVADEQIRAAQADASSLGAAHATALMQAAQADAGGSIGGRLDRLPSEAVQNLVGTLADGSPLRAMLDAFGPDASQQVQDALVGGLAIGKNPRLIAKDIQQAMGVNLTRALRIARTETLRAYRTSSLDRYQANADLLRGWRWRSARSPRTCAVCWAMDGTEHPLSEPFASHISCRCTPIPLLKNAPSTDKTGAERFAELSPTVQQDILGPEKFELYQQGRITLNDLVGERNDPRWGKGRYEKSLKALQGGRGAVRSEQGNQAKQESLFSPQQLLLDTYAAQRLLSPQEARVVLRHIANAAFNSDTMKIAVRYRDLVVHGQVLGARPKSLLWHLAQRTILERQWTLSTTEQEYLQDIQSGILHETARIVVYRQGTRMIAGVLSDYRIPVERRGEESLPLFYAVYEIDRGILLSGYQASEVATIKIPEDAVWESP